VVKTELNYKKPIKNSMTISKTNTSFGTIFITCIVLKKNQLLNSVDLSMKSKNVLTRVKMMNST